jgi:hypothetical protein
MHLEVCSETLHCPNLLNEHRLLPLRLDHIFNYRIMIALASDFQELIDFRHIQQI